MGGQTSGIDAPHGGNRRCPPSDAFNKQALVVDTGFYDDGEEGYQGFWANADEAGWGIYLAHQADVVFGIWLTYAPNGNPLWYSMPLAKGEGNSYSGPIMFSTGPAFDDALYDVNRVGAMEVGSATMTFDDGDNGHLEYSLPGLYSGTRGVARQVFGASDE